MPFGQVTTKGQRRPVEVLRPEEVRQILRGTSKRGPCGVRDRALIATLYRVGLRLSEALRLAPKDFDVDTRVITVLCGKGGKRRVVAADAEAAAFVRNWLDARAALQITRRAPLFCTLRGGAMSGTQVRRHLHHLAGKVGLDKPLRPHLLRHTFASELADERMDIRVIQAALGHEHLSTTEVYIRHLNAEVVVDALKVRTWAE